MTFLVIGPAWSKEDAKATIPYLEQLPYVGFKPTVPVKEAGCLIDPPVSVPIVAGVSFAAKAEAEPPDEPPGTKLSSIGLITFPKWLVSFDEPIANSSQFNFPSNIAPEFQRFWVTVDSYVGTKFSKILLLAVVLTFFVQKRSFTANGTPGSFFWRSGFASNFFEFFKASSKVSSTYVLSFFDDFDLSTYADVMSFDEISLDLIFFYNFG